MRNGLIVLTAVLLLIPAVAKAQNNPPVADAGPDQAVFVGHAVRLDGTGSYDPDGDPIVLYMWTMDTIPLGSNAELDNPFGDTPTFTPDMEGVYDVLLVVSDGELESVADTVQIIAAVNQPPVADAEADPQQGPAPLTVVFDGTGSMDPEGGVLYADWTFGDGSLPVQGLLATHTYSAPGSYRSTLTVVDDQGLLDTDDIYITVCGGGINCPPVADAGQDQTIIVDTTTRLHGSATDPDDDPIVGWLWSVESAPAGSSPTIQYPDESDPRFFDDVIGDYVLSLIAFDGTDWSEPDFVTIHLRELLPPVAVINVDVTSGYAPLTLHFDGSDSTVDPFAGELAFDWDFDDGSAPSPEESPVHIFESPGTYTVVLGVLDGLSQYDEDFVEINVEELPPAWGEASVIGMRTASHSKGLNCLVALLIPIGAVLFWKGLRNRR
jgi:PKD repeat protein